VRIDFDTKQIACSVQDLIHDATYRRIGVERGDGFRRMWLGQEVHSRRAEECSNADPNYRAEMVLTHRLQRQGWTIDIAGRLDGISVDRESRTITIEEVKSLHFDLELAALFRSEKLQRHLYQLMLYALFVSRKPEYQGFTIQPQLVLIDIVGGEVRLVEAPFETADATTALDNSIQSLLETLESDLALRAAKRSFADLLPFPHPEMRPYQKEMIDSVSRAVRQKETLLISAPTGVGKTIAAIYPALRESLALGKKLFYLTSKTLQQEIAVETLKMLNDGSFRVLRIRAKQKMCAHSEMICHEDFCPYAARYSDKMERSGLRSRIVSDQSYFDPDLTFEMARSEEVCPFEVSLELIDDADVIVCDYNYIFDPYVGLKTYQQDDDYGDTILVIDEAHNLIDRGRGYYSPELNEADLGAIENHLRSRACNLDGWEDLLSELRGHFQELSQLLDSTGGLSLVRDGAWPPAWGLLSGGATPRPEPQQKQCLAEFSKRFFHRQRSEWERLVIQYISWKIQQKLVEEDDPLVDFYFRLLKFANLLEETGDDFAHIVEWTVSGLKLKIFCKDASKFLGKIIDSSHATIALSATLQPFDFYRQNLGFPQSRTAELSLPSPFPRENRKIVVIPEVDTTYKHRARHYGTIARMIGEMASSTDGNFLSLFPSYAFLQEVSSLLPVMDKEVLIQRSDMTDWERSSVLEALRRQRRNGTLVLAVSGGMYAEGIDYQGDMLSGVFVVGPALPAVTFEQELLKQYFDELYGAGFEYAYLIPGMTRVVQSAGRVIRSETDIGVIALLCRRFTFESYTRFFPEDWYESSPRELVSKKPADAIRSFFELKKSAQLRIFD
jgi:DNA excision repair protein ERCC-2